MASEWPPTVVIQSSLFGIRIEYTGFTKHYTARGLRIRTMFYGIEGALAVTAIDPRLLTKKCLLLGAVRRL